MNVYRSITTGWIAMLMLAPLFLRAQADSLVITLPEISVEAYPAAKEQPAAVALLPGRDLYREEGVTLVSSLQRIPGVFFQSGALNTNRLSVRGVGSRTPFGTAKIRAYLDEIPLTNGIGETAMEELDPSFLEQVAVWRGPAPAAYGAGLGGMLHLKTANSAGRQGAGFELRNTVGSFGLQSQVFKARLQPEGQRFSLQAGLSRLHSDGFRANNRVDRWSGLILGKFQAGQRHTFTVLGQLVDLNAQIPSSLNETDYRNTPRIAAPNWAAIKGYEDYNLSNVGLAWRSQWNAAWSGVLSVFQRARQSYEPRPFNILRENARSHGARALVRKEAHGGRLELQAGGEFFSERYDWQINAIYSGELGELLADNSERRRYAFGFAEANWRLSSKITLHTGLNINHTAYDLSDLYPQDSVDISGQRRFPPVLSPRISLLRQGGGTAAFLTLSRGLSAPTLEETLAPDGAINPDILPERGWNLELGLRRRPGEGLFFYEISLYQMWIRDLLVARRTAEDQYIGVNAGRTLHRGIEAMGGLHKRFRPARHELRVYAGVTLADYAFVEFEDDGRDYSGKNLPGAPGFMMQAGLDGRYAKRERSALFCHLSSQAMGRQYADDANETSVDGYMLLNAKVGWEGPMGKRWKVELSGGVNNLLDARYPSMLAINAMGFGGAMPRYYYPGVPRSGYIGLLLGYQ